MITLSSGVNKYKSDKYKFIVVYLDDRCPICNAKLEVQTIYTKDQNIKTKYYCKDCNFECPIKYNDDKENIEPIYDSSIYNFIQNFGEPKKRRK